MLKFAAAGGADVVIEIGDEALAVPPYPVAECVTWAGEIDAARRDAFERAAAASFEDPQARFHHLNAYQPRPADIFDVQALASDTPNGILRVASYCLPRAGVTRRAGVPVPGEAWGENRAAAFLAAAGVAALSPLARVLVGLPELRPGQPPPAGGGAGPLPPTPAAGTTTPTNTAAGAAPTGPASGPPSSPPSAGTPPPAAA